MNRNISDIVDLWRREAKEQSDAQKSDYIVAMIDRILLGAAELSASDVHFQPGRQSVEVRLRLDGVLHVFGSLPSKHASQIAARLKVLAGLLTYKIDAPQEGRVQPERIAGLDREMRISTAPTIHGERIVVRFFSPSEECRYIESLGFGEEIQERLHTAIRRRSGALLIVGPSGSGKTTTAYALLRELAERSETVRSIVSLEDPVEHAIDGVAQIEVSSRPESTLGGDEKIRALPLGRMLQYMMRQDPEVLLVGEIRERGTAEAAMQAALTGHLLISTFHAGSAVEAVGRFLELGIEPFVLRSSLSFVLCQRLLRRLCHCRKAVEEKLAEKLELRLQEEAFTLERYFEPVGCPDCGGTGYSGRLPVAEVLPLDDETVVHAILDRQSTGTIRRLARQHGMTSIAETVLRHIETGETSPLEAKRVLG